MLAGDLTGEQPSRLRIGCGVGVGAVLEGDALRSASHLLIEQHGVAGLRDLAEVLAADMAKLMTKLARVEGRTPLEVLDEWSHDEPPPDV